MRCEEADWSSGQLRSFRGEMFYASHPSVGGKSTLWVMDFWTLQKQIDFVYDDIGSTINSEV